jgi:hypothetical protein
MLTMAGAEALVGNCEAARRTVDSGLKIIAARNIEQDAALIFAVCHDSARAEATVKKLITELPNDFRTHRVIAPMVRASIALNRGDAQQTIDQLRNVAPYERTIPAAVYLRGLAFLKNRNAELAASEFQKIHANPGFAGVSVLYPLSYLGAARAAISRGDQANARTTYDEFFALWKDADPDIPILIEARREYSKLHP